MVRNSERAPGSVSQGLLFSVTAPSALLPCPTSVLSLSLKQKKYVLNDLFEAVQVFGVRGSI